MVKGEQFFYIRDANMNQLELSRYVFCHGFAEKTILKTMLQEV